jgi:hypothetical protein
LSAKWLYLLKRHFKVQGFGDLSGKIASGLRFDIQPGSESERKPKP